ncbi:hypothetical protein WICMUC_004453 [Wickerhamomyces mucosus]|uniref:DNA polymerase V n=1 Tax=Wickerhamomyces mucosus TaxID=1378264 RepID=A0A9P8PHS4_9ASCO|nr:hypothetical protein WICMUC_004453 [Wickerhamomyces mucosus]
MTVSRDHYYRLSSDIEKERIDAAVQLINELTETNEEDEWDYALKRLIKGLSSSRGSSRLGFSMCLTEVAQIRVSNGKLTVEDLINSINGNTKITGSMKGNEERSILFGKLFGLQSLSSLINGKALNTEFEKYIDSLIDLACSKSWIREPSLFTIYKLIPTLTPSNLKYVFIKLDQANLSLSIEGLAIYLIAPVSFNSELQSIKFQNSTWKFNNPLNRSNLTLLTKILKDISIGDEESETESKLKKKGSWSPRLHFVWPSIISKLTTAINIEEDYHEEDEESKENNKKRKKSSSKPSKKSKSKTNSKVEDLDQQITVEEFFKVIIDENFFNEKSSHERKYWGFEIFQLFFQAIKHSQINHLFTKNFMRTLINQSSDSNRLLNKIAKKTLSKIIETTTQEPDKIIPTLNNLLVGEFGGLQFDKLTKSKTVESILSIDGSNLQLSKFFIQFLQNKQNNDLKTEKWGIDQLLHLVRNKKSSLQNSNDLEWVDLILKALVEKSYFKPKHSEPVQDAEDEEVSENNSPIVEFAQERLNSILSDVISIPRTDNQTWSYKALSYILEFQSSTDLVPIFQFDEEINTIKDKSLKTLKKIKSKRESLKHLQANSKLLVFELLFSMILLQLFTGDSGDSVMTLEELLDYYSESKSKDDLDDLNENFIGIIEILLNFISQKSSLLKKLSLIVWENFCDKVDAEGLQLLYDVLNTKENKEGEKALFEGEDEDEDEDEDEEDDEKEELDDDDNSGDDEIESGSDSDDADDDDDDDDESNDEEDEEVDDINEVEKKTNVALAEALKVPYNGEIFLSSDDEDISSEESMDDEQMMQIDDHLSKIFKQRQDALNNVMTGNKRKQEVSDAKVNILNFKNRILEMLEIYVKKTSENELILSMILPLLNALKLTLDKNLGSKIHKLLKLKICKIKNINIKNFNRIELLEILNQIHKDMLKSTNIVDYNLSCSQCSIFLSKQILQIDEDNIGEIIELYCSLLKNWFKKKNSRLTSSTFFDFINWLNSKRSNNGDSSSLGFA